jgi:hypothetical protein
MPGSIWVLWRPRRAGELRWGRRRGWGLHRREVLRLRFAPAKTAGKEEPRETPLRMTRLAGARQTGKTVDFVENDDD